MCLKARLTQTLTQTAPYYPCAHVGDRGQKHFLLARFALMIVSSLVLMVHTPGEDTHFFVGLQPTDNQSSCDPQLLSSETLREIKLNTIASKHVSDFLSSPLICLRLLVLHPRFLKILNTKAQFGQLCIAK